MVCEIYSKPCVFSGCLDGRDWNLPWVTARLYAPRKPRDNFPWRFYLRWPKKKTQAYMSQGKLWGYIKIENLKIIVGLLESYQQVPSEMPKLHWSGKCFEAHGGCILIRGALYPSPDPQWLWLAGSLHLSFPAAPTKARISTHQEDGLMTIWLVVSTHLKNISQNGNLPQMGVKIKNIWNHHLAMLRNFTCILMRYQYSDKTIRRSAESIWPFQWTRNPNFPWVEGSL